MNDLNLDNAISQDESHCSRFRSVSDQYTVFSSTGTLLSGRLPVKIAKPRSLDLCETLRTGSNDVCYRNTVNLKRTVCEMNDSAHTRRRLSLNGLLSSTEALCLDSTSEEYDQVETNNPMIESLPTRIDLEFYCNHPVSTPSRAVQFVEHNVLMDNANPEQLCSSPSNDESDISQYGYEILPLNEENETSVHRRKRRRFERRNSKTPAMLLSMIYPVFDELQKGMYLHDKSSEVWNALDQNNELTCTLYPGSDFAQLCSVPRKMQEHDTNLRFTREDNVNDSIATAETLVNLIREREFQSFDDVGQKKRI